MMSNDAELKKPIGYRTCDECDGNGKKNRPVWVLRGPKKVTCEECDGKGKKPVWWRLTDQDGDWLR